MIVILLGCAGLLLPNVCRVRDAAARMSCQSNCKHLGISWHTYLDTFEHTVLGTHPDPDLPPERRLSWAVYVNPDIPDNDLFKRTERLPAWDALENARYTAVRHKTFVCPASPNAATTHTSYLGIAGVGPNAANLSVDDPRIGAFGYDRTLKWKEFTDGTANTILLLESRSGGPWAQGGSGTVRGLDPNDRPHHGAGRPFDADHSEKTWFNQKTSTVTMTLCDGSIRTLKESVAPDVLEALATVRGGEQIPAEW